MGVYINPPDESKESFLFREAEQLDFVQCNECGYTPSN